MCITPIHYIISAHNFTGAFEPETFCSIEPSPHFPKYLPCDFACVNTRNFG